MILEPENKDFKVKSDFEYSLENMQKVVGGYIEAITLFVYSNDRSIVAWINEEGKLTGLEPNVVLAGSDGNPFDIVVGNILFTAVTPKGNTVGLTEKEVEMIKNMVNFRKGILAPICCTRTLTLPR